MKKRRYFAGAAAILFLLLLCGFAPQSITEDKDAQVLLYETYGESEILVYTGRTTVLYRPDGRSAEAPFNGQYAVLHGDTVTVFAEKSTPVTSQFVTTSAPVSPSYFCGVLTISSSRLSIIPPT